jgi:hypothetical protein
MYIDLGTNAYDTARSIGTPDADTRTANFESFGLSGLIATSFYDFADSSIFGSLVDTNIPTEMVARGVPLTGTSGTALDGSTTVTINPINQGVDDIVVSLNNIAPPLTLNNEGYLQSWALRTEYRFDGTLVNNPSDPLSYNGGSFKLFFEDYLASTSTEVLAGTFLRADVALNNEIAAVILYTTVDTIRDNFLYAQNETTGLFEEVEGGVGDTVRIDFEVDPAIPGLDELLLTAGAAGTFATRQSAIDGSATVFVPVPAPLALLGLGLLAIPAVRRAVRS